MKFHARTACMAGCLGLFALQGPFALAQTASNGVTVYGIADLGVRQASGLTPGNAPSPGRNGLVGSGIDTTSRLGFRGRDDLGSGLTALFNLESGLNLNDGTSINSQKWFDRAAFLGLSGEAGTLTLGRQTTLLGDSLGKIDPLGFRFAPFNPNVALAGLSAHGLGQEYGPAGSANGSFRLDNTLKYSLKTGAYEWRALRAQGQRQSDAPSQAGATELGLFYDTPELNGSLSLSQFQTAEGLTLKAVSAGLGAAAWGGRWSASYARHVAETSTTQETRRDILSFGGVLPLSAQLDLVLALYHVKRQQTGLANDGFNRAVGFLEYKLSRRSLVYAELDQTQWQGAAHLPGTRRTATGVSLGIKQVF